MTPAVLSRLRRRFKRTKDRSTAKDIHRKVEEAMHVAAAAEGVEFSKSPPPSIDTSLHWEGFVSAIDDIFGHHKFRTHARQLCQALDPLGSGRVRWGELLSRLQRAPRASPLCMPPLCSKPQQLRHCKRECIVKLVSVEREDSFCYVAVSRGGRAGVYSGHLKLLSTYQCLAYSSSAVGGWLAVGTARGALCELHVRAPLPADSPPYCTWHGVSCFHWVAELKLVVTGSCDGAVRLWDVAQPAPYARLSAPAAMPVLDVAVVPHLQIAVAYHNNCTVNIWDLQQECLLHSVKIKFPFLGVLGKKVEFGTYCIHPGPPRKNEATEDLQDETTLSSRPDSSLSGEDDRGVQSENNS
ncbi:unnamed protein product [Parnassius apollo]|uniref:(apollo) hypothetical protein n=1 Tax=Parnassius apollo TaxID=110799 RepID=A0A8S3X404_PARAO|nr:unnamed protein product [Parnassius apollo]